jgi:uncharacterized membrane protein YcaP (DUF421 family)
MTELLGTDLATGVQVVIATVAIVLVMLVLVRVGGQRSLAAMTAADVACVSALGAVVGRTSLLAVPTLAAGVIALTVLVGLRHLLSALERGPRWLPVPRRGPVVVLRDGRLCPDELRRARLSDDDLRQALRLAGVVRRDEARLVVLERSGRISVMRGSEPEEWLLADLRRGEAPGSGKQ